MDRGVGGRGLRLRALLVKAPLGFDGRKKGKTIKRAKAHSLIREHGTN